MANAPVLSSTAELEEALQGQIPVLLYLWYGEAIRTDVRQELDKATTEHGKRIRVLRVDVSSNPDLAARFEVGKHPLLIGYHNGEIVIRRNRPWNTDVQATVEELLKRAPAVPAAPAAPKQPAPAANNKPVKVTDATFEKEVINSPIPVLVDFWAEWCGPCKQIAPALEKLASEFAGKVRIAKVNVDENPGLSQVFQIKSIPLLMFVKGGKIVGQQAGALPEPVLRDVINQLITLKI
jgi:thioredoxin 1